MQNAQKEELSHSRGPKELVQGTQYLLLARGPLAAKLLARLQDKIAIANSVSCSIVIRGTSITEQRGLHGDSIKRTS